MTPNFFSPLSFVLLFLNPGSGIRDPEWVKIRIRDKHPGSTTLAGRVAVTDHTIFYVTGIFGTTNMRKI
jgi:hypothetical protein